jgi:hypothetical protein
MAGKKESSKMKSTPLLMTPPLVSACLAGRKTETRRVILPQPKPEWQHITGPRFCTRDHLNMGQCVGDVTVKCRYGAAGDELWIKENHFRFGKWVKAGRSKAHYDGHGIWRPTRQKWRFKATTDEVKFEDHPPQIVKLKKSDLGWRRRPSLFMSRNLSRLTLVLDAVAVERVQDITEDAAQREGVSNIVAGNPDDNFRANDFRMLGYRAGFKYVWDHINAKRLGGSIRWEANPWVFVLKFHVKK